MTESPAIEPDDFRFRLLCDMWSHESDLIDAGSDVGLHGGACGQFCGFEVFDTCDGGQGHQRTCDGEFDKFVVVLGDSRAEYWKPIVALCLYYRLRQYIGFDSYFLFRLRPKSGRTSPGRTSASRLAVRPAASSSHATAAMAALSVQSSGGAMNSSMRSLRHMVLSACRNGPFAATPPPTHRREYFSSRTAWRHFSTMTSIAAAWNPAARSGTSSGGVLES